MPYVAVSDLIVGSSTTVVGLSYFRHDEPSVGTGRIAPDVQIEVLWSPDGFMYILWKSYQAGYVSTCGKLPFGTRPALCSIVCSVGEERMSPYAGALCLTCGRSRWKQTLTDGWLTNGTRNDRLRGGKTLLCSAICVTAGDVSPRCKSHRALSPRTKTFSTTTTSSAAVLTLICACLGGIPLCRRSIFFCQCLPIRISLRQPDFSLCGSQRRSIRLLPSLRPPSLRASIWMQFRRRIQMRSRAMLLALAQSPLYL